MQHSEFLKHYGIRPLRAIARRLRKRPTGSEARLWQALRNRQLDGLKFLRQHPIGVSIVDFYCHEKRLVVEVDGGMHKALDVHERDRMRQELIEQHGLQVLRCSDADVEQNLKAVLDRIRTATVEI